MELREKIAELLCDRLLSNGNQVTEGECVSYAAEVLDIPEIKEALRSQCSSCDGARGPLLCTECIRDFIKAA